MAVIIKGRKNVSKRIENPRDGLTASQTAQLLRHPALI